MRPQSLATETNYPVGAKTGRQGHNAGQKSPSCWYYGFPKSGCRAILPLTERRSSVQMGNVGLKAWLTILLPICVTLCFRISPFKATIRNIPKKPLVGFHGIGGVMRKSEQKYWLKVLFLIVVEVLLIGIFFAFLFGVKFLFTLDFLIALGLVGGALILDLLFGGLVNSFAGK